MEVLQRDKINKKSATVENIDEQVRPLVAEMAARCKEKVGGYSGGFALAHCQVEKNTPLTFFVYKNGDAVVNPEILQGTSETMHEEGCLSLAFAKPAKVRRFRHVLVSYTLVTEKETRTVKKWIAGQTAFIFQHEIDHFNLVYVDGK